MTEAVLVIEEGIRMKKLKIVLKNGYAKKYPWDDIRFAITDEHVIVTENNPSGTFIFRAPALNVEYCEAIEEDDEEEDDYDVVFSN